MKILIIDAQGGGIGKQLIQAVKESYPEVEIGAVGTNSAATMAMLKAGADFAATGENPVIVNARTADIIMGPIGIAIADSMYGEITKEMAAAVGQSRAEKVLIPINHCSNYIVGVENANMRDLISGAVNHLKKLIK